MKHLIKSVIRNFIIRDEWNKWIIDYLDEDDVIFVGWMRGGKADIEKLRLLGVKGPMKWTPDSKYKEFGGGFIERCVIAGEMSVKLNQFPGFMNGSTFTGIDSLGRQVLWGGNGLARDKKSYEST